MKKDLIKGSPVLDKLREELLKQAEAGIKRKDPSSKKFKKLQDMFIKKYKPTDGVC